MPMHDAATIARRWCELYSDGTPDSYGSDRFLELYAPDCEWIEHSNLFGVRRGGPEDIRKLLPQTNARMRNRRADFKRVVASGDEAAMHYTWSATLLEELNGHPKGTRIQLDIAAFLRVRDGKIVRHEEFVTHLRPV